VYVRENENREMKLLLPAFVILLVALLTSCTPVGGTFYPADDVTKFAYAGRWQLNLEGEGVARADWPCSGVQFTVTTTAATGGPSSISIALRLNLDRVRVSVAVTSNTSTDGAPVENTPTILEGNANVVEDYNVTLENKNAGTTYTISLTKLTQAAPYGNGLGQLLTSVLEFHGVEIDANVTTLGSPSLLPPSRRVTLIGASDTAGYCVDGTPETIDAYIYPWKYGNCNMGYPGVLGRSLNAEISVQAIAGIGLTQNAYADVSVLLGEDTMPDYYNRTLQTEEQPLWNFTEWHPDLVIVSLGGNDFNHQKTVPSNATFRAAYEEFLLQIAKPYMEGNTTTTTTTQQQPPTIVSVCGQGDPTEVERDPNNDRCRPCPHVEDATESFRTKYSESVRVEYIFIPCDGTVVTGDGDIGCEGHKNQLGQKRVAEFLEPRLREIMAWPNELDPEPTPVPTSGSNGGNAMAVRWIKILSTYIGLWAAW